MLENELILRNHKTSIGLQRWFFISYMRILSFRAISGQIRTHPDSVAEL